MYAEATAWASPRTARAHIERSLGSTKMRRARIDGKCGLLALPRCLAEATTPAKTGRAPVVGASAST